MPLVLWFLPSTLLSSWRVVSLAPSPPPPLPLLPKGVLRSRRKPGTVTYSANFCIFIPSTEHISLTNWWCFVAVWWSKSFLKSCFWAVWHAPFQSFRNHRWRPRLKSSTVPARHTSSLPANLVNEPHYPSTPPLPSFLFWISRSWCWWLRRFIPSRWTRLSCFRYISY